MTSDNVVVLLNSEEGRSLVKKKCKEAEIPITVLQDLIAAEADQQGKRRKAGLWEEFDRIFDSLEEDEELAS